MERQEGSGPLSLADLEAIQLEMIGDRTAIQQGAPPSSLPASILRTEGVYTLGINREVGAIRVYVEQPSPQLEADFQQYYGIPLEIHQGVAHPL